MTTSAPTLFALAREGDREALDQLLREHRDSITAVCRRRLRSRVDADDAVQETMVRAMGALESLRDETRLRSYLCRIAERVCLDMMRAGARPMPVADDTGGSDEPEALTIRREEAELVRRTLEALSERQAQALWMRDAMGEPVPAVAEHLGMTEGSTRVLLTRARRRMRDGWAKVAAMVPGLGVKLPAPLAKLVTSTGLVPAIAAPAAVLVAAVLVLPGLGGTAPDAAPAGQTAFPPPPAAQDDAARTLPSVALTAASVTRAGAPAEARRPVATRAVGAPGPAGPAAPEMRVSTGAVGDVAVDRDDPEQDDVTAGDEEIIGVGTSVDDALDALPVEAPAEDLTDGTTSP